MQGNLNKYWTIFLNFTMGDNGFNLLYIYIHIYIPATLQEIILNVQFNFKPNYSKCLDELYCHSQNYL